MIRRIQIECAEQLAFSQFVHLMIDLANGNSENDLKHEILLEKNLLRKESPLPTSLEQIISFIAPYRAAFDCACNLL